MKFGIAAAAFLGVGLLAGCHGYARLYPVQGPLATLTPPPVYTAKITLTPNWNQPVSFGAHAQGGMGKISVALAKGEQFNGTWKQVYNQPGAANTASDPLASAWDAVYGKDYYTAHVLGASLFVHTDLTGAQGSTLAVEWYEHGEGGNSNPRLVTRGIAKDGKGDVYKVVF